MATWEDIAEQSALMPNRLLLEEPDCLREESDEELRARITGQAPRQFDDDDFRTIVHCEADKIDAPRTLRIRKQGAGCYEVYVRGVLLSWRAELSARVRERVPVWVNVSVYDED